MIILFTDFTKTRTERGPIMAPTGSIADCANEGLVMTSKSLQTVDRPPLACCGAIFQAIDCADPRVLGFYEHDRNCKESLANSQDSDDLAFSGLAFSTPEIAADEF